MGYPPVIVLINIQSYCSSPTLLPKAVEPPELHICITLPAFIPPAGIRSFAPGASGPCTATGRMKTTDTMHYKLRTNLAPNAVSNDIVNSRRCLHPHDLKTPMSKNRLTCRTHACPVCLRCLFTMFNQHYHKKR